MNLRPLVSPALYGGAAAAVVGALGYTLAVSQSISIYLTSIVYVFAGLTAFSLLAGTSSFNENSETADPLVDQDDLLSAPTESGAPRRILLICFSIGLVLAGMVGVTILA
jgi:hypothetical protein